MTADLTDFLEEDDDPSAVRASNVAVFRFLWRQWMRRPHWLAAMGVFALATTACDLGLPIAAGALVDALAAPPAADGASEAHVWRVFAIFVGLAAAVYTFRQGLARSEIWFSTRNMAEMTAESFAQVQRFSADWHANTFAGATVRKISRGMWAYDMATATLTFGLVPTVLVLTGLPIYMLMNWPIVGAYAAVVVAAFMTLTFIAARGYIKPANTISNARDSAIGAALADSIGANAVVKSFGAEAREDARFASVMRVWRDAAFRTWRRYANMGLFTGASLVTLQAGMVGLLIHEWSLERASPGDVAFAISAFLLMTGYMRRFGEEVQQVQRALDELADLAIFETAAPGVADAADARPFKARDGAITFENVTFRYANQDRPIYERFALDIRPGERVALVGPTGSGKSTFVKLIQRLYDVDAGRVVIDGQDVRHVTQDSLRRAIALVPQDPALFHRSIASNIGYARPDASLDEIKAAAERARAHDFIMRLPKTYDTLVGERGVKLSGGERQRVAVARALLADAPILVLDEATSSLDNETERLVQEAMEELMAGRTTIVIAHRLSTIRQADRILVFDHGRIVEQGRHEELVDKPGGVYARLHALAAEAA